MKSTAEPGSGPITLQGIGLNHAVECATFDKAGLEFATSRSRRAGVGGDTRVQIFAFNTLDVPQSVIGLNLPSVHMAEQNDFWQMLQPIS